MNFGADLVGPLVWSCVGFVAGFLAARLSSDVHEIRDVALSEHAGPERRRPASNTNRLLGVFLVLLSVATVTLLAVSNAKQRAIVDCQTDVNRRVVETINQRADAAAKDKAALDGMVAAVLTLKSEQARRQALAAYVAVAKQTTAERARTPYPNPRDFDCQETK
jgi:hypothetical protein